MRKDRRQPLRFQKPPPVTVRVAFFREMRPGGFSDRASPRWRRCRAPAYRRARPTIATTPEGDAPFALDAQNTDPAQTRPPRQCRRQARQTGMAPGPSWDGFQNLKLTMRYITRLPMTSEMAA